MAKYSEINDPRIREVIDTLIAEIVQRLQPKSIIVAGGFGRDEASFLKEDGKLKALSDCEIAILSRRSIPRGQLAKLSRELTCQTGMDVVISNSPLLRAYSRLSIPSYVSRRAWRPSIQHYDLKYGSRVVFGENILDRLPEIKAQDIPLWEGLRLMFNRMAASLKYYPAGSKDMERSEAIYWINKVIIACQDALLLSVGTYHYSYKARSLAFQEMFPRRFGKLGERIPGILLLASKAAEYKLKPNKDAYPGNIAELWFDAAEICDQVFRYIVKEDLGISFDSYVEFQRKYLKHPNIRKKYYLGVISSPVAQNLFSTMRMIANYSCRFPSPKLIQHIRTPWKHIVYSIIPLVYFAISPSGEIDELQLEQARDTLSLFKKLKPKQPDPWQEWEFLREQAAEVWHTLCY